MTGVIANLPKFYFVDNNGHKAAGYKLYTYLAGTTTNATTWQDQALTQANTNPITLDSRGECDLWLDSTKEYKLVLKTPAGATVWTQDDVSGALSGGELAAILKSQVNRVVDSIADLKALDKTLYTRAFVTGYSAAGDGGGGAYYYDSTDTTTADNGGAIIVATDGARWKLVHASSVSVKQFGAKGDGAADDTAALTLAHNAGVPLYYPQGTYLISAPIPMLDRQRVVGVPSESYIDWVNDYQKAVPSYAGVASVIQYKAGSHGAIFSGEPEGVSIYGMVFRVGQVRTADDVLMDGMGGLGTFESCKFENLDKVFKAPVSYILSGGKLLGNRFFVNGSIVDESAWVDTVVIGNIFTSNGRCFGPRAGGGYFQLVGNRFEFNDQVLNAYQCKSGIVTGNLFDCCNRAAISLFDTSGWQITGNKFNGNGLAASGAGFRSHIELIGNSDGNTISGNHFTAVRSDNGARVTPYLLELNNVSGKSNKFIGNSDEDGWVTAPIVDTFGTAANCFHYDSFTIPTGIGSPGAAGDLVATYINSVNNSAIGSVRVFLKEDRKITSNIYPLKVILEGIGAAPINLSRGVDNYAAFQGINNIKFTNVTYKLSAGTQYASAQPSEWGDDGVWEVGKSLMNITPAAGGYIGWVKTAASIPDTWKTWGGISA